MIRSPNKPCRRCGRPVEQPGRGRPRLFCGPECRRLVDNERRKLKHDLANAQDQVKWYSGLAAKPVPGLATPQYAAAEAQRWSAVAERIERELAELDAPSGANASE